MKKELFFSLLLSVLLSCSASDKSTLSNSYPQSTEDGYEKENIEFQKAIEDANKAIELNPSDANAYYRRGKAKANLQDYQGAIEDYTDAIYFSPGLPPGIYYYHRGLSYIKLKEKDKACSDWVIAGELRGIQAVFKMIEKYCR